MVKDTSISVTKVSWSPDGNLIGEFPCLGNLDNPILSMC